MVAMVEITPIKVSGRSFGREQIVAIRKIIDQSPNYLRTEIARRVCTASCWYDARGEPKAMSCRVALLRLHREGHIELPAPRNGKGNGKTLLRQRSHLPSPVPVSCPVNEIDGIELQLAYTKAESALCNTLIDQHHYLGYQPLPGAQLR